MAASLPPGTTAPRGLPLPDQICWPLFASRDLFELRYGRALVEALRRPGSIPVYGTNGRCGSHDKALFKGPGVILGRKGQGPLGVEWSQGDYWVIDTAYSLIPLRPDIDLKYAYFLVKHIGLNHLKDGTSNPTLSRDSFGAQALPLPPLNAQRAIAHILGTLDDKIELNQQMNETLEAMARALFKSWFVDFLPVRAKQRARAQTGDPVRAKTEGRDPLSAVPGKAQAGGLPKHLADLFPGSFEDSELGEIPRGWFVCGLDEIARFLNGLALQKFPPKDERSLPVIKIAQLRAGNTNGADTASGDIPSDYMVDDADVLFSWSGSLDCVLWAGGRGALNQHLFKVTSSDFPKWLYYLWIHQHLSGFRHIAAAKATTMGHIQRHHLSQAKVVLPPRPLLTQATRYIGPLIDVIPKNGVQMRTLSALRDSLLPKLISGETRIEDVRRIVGMNP